MPARMTLYSVGYDAHGDEVVYSAWGKTAE